jgi:hypothetical protein
LLLTLKTPLEDLDTFSVPNLEKVIALIVALKNIVLDLQENGTVLHLSIVITRTDDLIQLYILKYTVKTSDRVK